MADQTLNLPSLILVVLVTSLAIRYFFFGSRNPAGGSRGQIDPSQIDQIATMFPQVDRRSIQWDLQRAGGSVTATTERILTRGSLDTPPPSFQPRLPPPSTTSPAASAVPPRPSQPDLITRYNLKSKLSATGDPIGEANQSATQNRGSWSESKNERADLLRRRREEMILNARRKMESREKQPGQ